MSSLVSYEPLVDGTAAIFLAQTEKLFAKPGASCNFSRWLQFFAFDVIGELTWSKRLGFVEKNEDVQGIIEFVAKFLEYAGPVISISSIILPSYVNIAVGRSNTHIGFTVQEERRQDATPAMGCTYVHLSSHQICFRMLCRT
jgi:hypothetical protein